MVGERQSRPFANQTTNNIVIVIRGDKHYITMDDNIMGDQDNRFTLAGEEDAFKEKAGNLFSALNDVQYSPTQDVDSYVKSDPLKDERQTKLGGAHGSCTRQSRSSTASSRSGHTSKHDESSGSSMMPPPRAPAFKRKSRRPLPGHLKNPSKYTKYSLDDVPEQQMTQKSNTAAALAFLQEIDDKQNKDQTEDEPPEGSKPMFKKPTHKTASRTVGEAKGVSNDSSESGSDTVSQNKPKLKQKHKSKKEKEVKLSHLEYDEEE